MTPNPDSPKFVRHEIPDDASATAIRLREIHKLLKANIEACVWHHVTSDCIRLDYNTYDGRVRITVGLPIRTSILIRFPLYFMVTRNCDASMSLRAVLMLP